MFHTRQAIRTVGCIYKLTTIIQQTMPRFKAIEIQEKLSFQIEQKDNQFILHTCWENKPINKRLLGSDKKVAGVISKILQNNARDIAERAYDRIKGVENPVPYLTLEVMQELTRLFMPLPISDADDLIAGYNLQRYYPRTDILIPYGSGRHNKEYMSFYREVDELTKIKSTTHDQHYSLDKVITTLKEINGKSQFLTYAIAIVI